MGCTRWEESCPDFWGKPKTTQTHSIITKVKIKGHKEVPINCFDDWDKQALPPARRKLHWKKGRCFLREDMSSTGIRRVKGSKKLGMRLGNWLTADEDRTLWQLPNAYTPKGKEGSCHLGRFAWMQAASRRVDRSYL
jgi:hypothetical protein